MKKLLFGSAALFALALAGAAQASPVVIQNNSVQAGLNDVGTLGSGNTAPPGILYDPTGTGNYGNNDFLTPGSPFEGFYVTADGGYQQHSNNADFDGSSNATTFTATAPSTGSATGASWTGTSQDGSLTIQNDYSLSTIGGRSVIAITTTLTNNTNAAFTNLAFLRTLDPDPDVNNYYVFDTINSVLSADQACATGANSGQTICLATDDTAFTHKAGVSDTATWTTSPADYLAGQNGGNGDYALGLAFALGDLGAGQSDTLSYYYALGADKGTASGGTGVPEPASLLLLGAGLAGMGALRRKRKTA